ncbi:MAG: transporter [Lachnospiraceae bacterium]|nr:transporter [Lachnospiraceae bacterium]
MKKGNLKILFLLHIMLMIYSMSSICSKKAAGTEFLSLEFCLYYGAIIALLGFYAIGWQQIIKRLPLTTAFANKAVTVVWGIIWGALFFSEPITVGKVVGAILVVAGVVLYAYADAEDKSGEEGNANG